MKLVVAAILSTLLSVATPAEPAVPVQPLSVSTPAVASLVDAEVARLDASDLPRATAEALDDSVRIAEPVRVPLGRKVVDVPTACRDAKGRYDVLIHFHGVPSRVEQAFSHSGVAAVLVVVNLGIGSGPYEDAMRQDGSLAQMLDEIDRVMQKHCPAKSGTGARARVALSAWSAGYGAAYRVLANKHDRELVDAILLADGLHAGFRDKFRQHMNEQQMAPFTHFAELAAKGDKLFAITHTAIVTPSYASTTETSKFLMDQLGAELEQVNEVGPLPSMHLTTKADMGGFHVRGFAGGDTNAHCDHLYAIGDTLFSQLATRWSGR